MKRITGMELRALLGRVEAHGGLPGLTIDRSPVWSIAVDGTLTFSPSGVEKHAWLEHHLVGVLKRDIEKRGCLWTTGFAGHEHYAAIDTDSELVEESGNSELEALLKVWLAVAEVERWE